MAFNASELIPIMVEEVLPGDTWQHKENIMARFATPIAPVVDDIDLETFYFFIPNRITWPGWEDFITGEESITIPQVIPYVTGTGNVIRVNSVLDHMGLRPQTYSNPAWGFNVLPIWAYFTVYNEWFRDQNLQNEWVWPDPWTVPHGTHEFTYNGLAWGQQCLRANKRHDYFTSSLPFAQKGPAVTIPLGTFAPIEPLSPFIPTFSESGAGPAFALSTNMGGSQIYKEGGPATATSTLTWEDPALVVNLGAATASTINAFRLAITTQQLLEKDARGGSRYVEQLLVHFGVRSPDYRLQRPEYLGGSKIPITVNPIAQTAAYDAEPDPSESSALGNLGAEMHASGSKRTFTYAATEHGYILGLAVVRATPTYQQGTRRHWRRLTRLDYYFPTLANIGEQAVATQEIYQNASNTPVNATWGYQERNAEYRYTPNEITGVLRSDVPQPLDWWHYAEEFGAEPALNDAFITDKTQETLSRSLATAPSEQWSAQVIMDVLHDSQVGRLMPAYSVPGLNTF